jgi:hypothetical protein
LRIKHVVSEQERKGEKGKRGGGKVISTDLSFKARGLDAKNPLFFCTRGDTSTR